jgi:uncharacterized membrane protein
MFCELPLLRCGHFLIIAGDKLSSSHFKAGQKLHVALVAPQCCSPRCIGAPLTDIVYHTTMKIMWADFSSWLLVVGVIMGVLAAIAGLINFSQQPLDPCPGPPTRHSQNRPAAARASD